MFTVGLHTLIAIGGFLVAGGILVGRITEYNRIKEKADKIVKEVEQCKKEFEEEEKQV